MTKAEMLRMLAEQGNAEPRTREDVNAHNREAFEHAYAAMMERDAVQEAFVAFLDVFSASAGIVPERARPMALRVLAALSFGKGPEGLAALFTSDLSVAVMTTAACIARVYGDGPDGAAAGDDADRAERVRRGNNGGYA